MRLKKDNAHGIIWDAEKNCTLARAQTGIVETNDEAAIKKLKKLGFEIVEEPKEPAKD